MSSVHLRLTLKLSLVFSLLLSAIPGSVSALPADFVEEDLYQAQAKMIALEFLPDGRMLALRKTGEIHIFDPQDKPPLGRVDYMVITDINSDDERGLLDIALDPNFSSNNYFYLYYVNGSTNRARVSRFQHVENSGGTSSRGNLGSEQIIWEDNVDAIGCCHLGGSIVFGPDGKLYFVIGDKFENNISQDLTKTGGKVYRLNKDGTIPSDNPDFSAIEPNAVPGIWAFGIRNPFRSSWDMQRNRLLMGEVGGNDQATATEDVHVGRAGANYGWPNCEGSTCNPTSPALPAPFDKFDAPLFSYDHAGVGAAIVGGFVYEGSVFPASFRDAYFYGDYARGVIRYLTFGGGGSVSGDFAFHAGADKITNLKEGPDGALYYTRFGAGAKIRRIRYLGSGGNQPPVITQASGDPISGADPLDVTFTGVATDNENDPLTYHWIFGDGVEADGAVISHTYNGNGSYSAVLQVSDGATTVASQPIQIDVGSAPEVTLLTPVDGTTFRAGETIPFSASATDADGTLGEANISWEILFHHNDHFHTGPAYSGSIGSLYVETTGHDWNDSTRYEFIVDVQDSDGLTDTASVFAFPDKVNLGLETIPPGQTIYLDEIPKVTPVVYDTLIDFQHNVDALSTACINDVQYTFDSWSDGGAAKHDIVVPDTDLTVVATYVLEGGACSVGPPVTPTITISSPVEGETIVGTDVTVQYEILGTGYDHVHFSIDSEPYIAEHNLTGTFVFNNVADGAHLIRAALVNANHSELTNPEAVTTVNVNVSQAGGDPGVVTLVSPSGTISERTPAYTWNADPFATRYRLKVADSTGTKRVNEWYSAEEAGCPSGTGTCSVTPTY
ncbi:MAG: PQQ-dependent sugar dehydrogenase, partial [Gammaproteobacteria bacterium]|nr:PQQ-dependent sugar dehydrogenase [Gammaproteobacteria bacterium]